MMIAPVLFLIAACIAAYVLWPLFAGRGSSVRQGRRIACIALWWMAAGIVSPAAASGAGLRVTFVGVAVDVQPGYVRVSEVVELRNGAAQPFRGDVRVALPARARFVTFHDGWNRPTLDGDRLRDRVTVPPGTYRLAYAYSVPGSGAIDLDRPLADPVDRLEAFVRAPARIVGPALAPGTAVTHEGQVLNRAAAQALPAGPVGIRIVGVPSYPRWPAPSAAIGLAVALAAGFGAAAVRARRSPATRVGGDAVARVCRMFPASVEPTSPVSMSRHRPTQRTPRSLVIVVLLAVVAAGCQPTVRVRGQATQPGGGLIEAPAPASLLPASKPSAERGRKVFEKACFACHGNEGFGDGPAAKTLTAPHKNPMTDFFGMFGMKLAGEKLPSRPANFHNQVAMRLNAPFTMVETISLGRPHTAMPSFGDKIAYGANRGIPTLTTQELWDVMFYEWSWATTPRAVALGRRLYTERAVDIGNGRTATCAACHGTAGDGRGGQLSDEMAGRVWGWKQQASPGIFTNVNLMAQRKPAELFQQILNGGGAMPGYRGKLTEDEIWALVDYVWTFVYEWRPARGQPASVQSMTPSRTPSR